MQIATKDQMGEGCQIVGIKKVPARDGKRMYTTYFAVCPWTEYELGREDYSLEGVSVQEFQTTKEFDIFVGDVVKFYYGRAFGSFQPIDDYKLLVRFTDVKTDVETDVKTDVETDVKTDVETDVKTDVNKGVKPKR